MEEGKRLLTTGQVAEIWGVSECRIRALLRTGELEGFRIGKSWRVPEEAVADYEQRNSNRRAVEAREHRLNPRPKVFKIV